MTQVNRNVSSRVRKVVRDGAYVTSGGRQFHTWVLATGNAWLPTVERWTGGWTSFVAKISCIWVFASCGPCRWIAEARERSCERCWCHCLHLQRRHRLQAEPMHHLVWRLKMRHQPLTSWVQVVSCSLVTDTRACCSAAIFLLGKHRCVGTRNDLVLLSSRLTRFSSAWWCFTLIPTA